MEQIKEDVRGGRSDADRQVEVSPALQRALDATRWANRGIEEELGLAPYAPSSRSYSFT
jgi:hypothetical protein